MKQDNREGLTQAVSKTRMFSDLSESQLRLVVDLMNEKTFAQETFLIHERFHSDDVFVVLRGQVEVELKVGMESRQIATFGQGEVLGELALVAREHQRSASVKAIDEVVVCRAAIPTLRDLFNRHTDVGCIVYRNLAGILASRLAESNSLARSAFEKLNQQAQDGRIRNRAS